MHTKVCPSCRHIHSRLGPWCSRCGRAVSNTGHAKGRLIRKGTLRPHRKFTSGLLAQHREHRSVKAAVSWCGKLLASAREDDVSRELRRLRDQGVSPIEVLETIGAVYALAHFDPHSLPDDQRFTFNVANAVFRLRPSYSRDTSINGDRGYRYERQKTTMKRDLGMTIRSTLGVFFRQLIERYEADQENERQLLSDLRAPLQPTSKDTA